MSIEGVLELRFVPILGAYASLTVYPVSAVSLRSQTLLSHSIRAPTRQPRMPASHRIFHVQARVCVYPAATQARSYLTSFSPGLHKYSPQVYEACIDSFNSLPIAALVDGRFFCVHGGISPELVELADLNKASLLSIFHPHPYPLFCLDRSLSRTWIPWPALRPVMVRSYSQFRARTGTRSEWTWSRTRDEVHAQCRSRMFLLLHVSLPPFFGTGV